MHQIQLRTKCGCTKLIARAIDKPTFKNFVVPITTKSKFSTGGTTVSERKFEFSTQYVTEARDTIWIYEEV